MSLRRFPWKAPRLTDNSFKLFASSPTPGTTPAEIASRRSSEGRPKSETQLIPGPGESRRSSAPDTQESSNNGSTNHHRHRHRHHHDGQGEEADGRAPPADAQGARIDAPTKDVLKGPWRLLRLLPRESRTIIGLMLEIDPKCRATLEQMMADPWISGASICRQIEGGKVVKAEGHQHTLEQSTTVAAGAGKD